MDELTQLVIVWSPTVQAVMGLLSVVVAFLSVRLSWKKLSEDREASARAIEVADMRSRQRAIIDLLIAQNTSPEYLQSLKTLRTLRENVDSCQLAEYVRRDDETRGQILSVLSQLEFISVGIRLGVFDEALFKELSYSNVIENWKAAAGFVYELRRQTKMGTLFQDFEQLAHRWEKDPIKKL